VPNVSEGRRGDVLAALAAAVGPGHLLDLHPDPAHNRAVLSMAGNAESIESRLIALVAESVERIDLRRHEGVHPRIGVADVVPVVPLDGATIDDAATLARRVGTRIHHQLNVPVFFYGAALGGPTLADIRAGRAEPVLGSDRHPSAGAVCVGARPPLLAYNVVLEGAGPVEAAALARGLRAGGPAGLPGVQALAFSLPGGVMQLSMNLVDLVLAPPGRVLAEVRRRAAEAGFAAGADEVVGLCPAAVATASARGRLLECRLAACAARLGGLEAAAQALAPLGPGSEALLLALERTADVWRTMRARGGLEGEAGAMLRHAGLQLRGALPADALEYRDRVRQLDAWLRELRS
jgi:glutamate formiminotransferase